jgi:hypothetical protein
MASVKFQGWFHKTGERRMDNLWTGYEAGRNTKRVGMGIMGGMAGYSLVSQANEYHHDLAHVYANDDRGIQSLPSTQADGRGYWAHNGGEPALGATGDLVFALHNLRHGGGGA